MNQGNLYYPLKLILHFHTFGLFHYSSYLFHQNMGFAAELAGEMRRDAIFTKAAQAGGAFELQRFGGEVHLPYYGKRKLNN